VDPVARGGEASVDTIRLLCRAHNQYEAERVYGAGFMDQRRREARERRAAVRAQETANDGAATCTAVTEARGPSADPTVTESSAESAARTDDLDVVPWLRRLGYRSDEARRAAKECEHIPEGPLEQRVRAALSYLAPRARVIRPCTASQSMTGA
jgi:hypothetical protein